MTTTRRDFLKQATALAPSLLGLAACNDAELAGLRRASLLASTLEQAPECPELFVPPGFRCIKLSETTTLSRANETMLVPQALDGMAAFRMPGHTIRLIRNHEITEVRTTPIGSRPYDPLGGGGTTSLEIAIHRHGQSLDLELTAEFVSLSGTLRNCAGGATPWGSWLACEETVAGISRGFARPHGYVFEVPVDAESDVDAVPLHALGRFVHEAVAVDPKSGLVYLTEDKAYDPPSGSPGSGFYRFLPVQRDDLQRGGRLQALAIVGRASYLTATGQVPGNSLPVRWIDIEDPDPANAEADSSAVFRQGLAGGAAIFQRLEGCWYGDGSIFFNATSGGDAGRGQVWQYRPAKDGGQLMLVFESPGASVLNKPDNICVSPRGGIVLCEDTDNRTDDHYIRGLTRSGRMVDLVRQEGGGDTSEFAGACFSPDGDILFFNRQGGISPIDPLKGATYAMWGRWKALGL